MHLIKFKIQFVVLFFAIVMGILFILSLCAQMRKNNVKNATPVQFNNNSCESNLVRNKCYDCEENIIGYKSKCFDCNDTGVSTPSIQHLAETPALNPKLGRF